MRHIFTPSSQHIFDQNDSDAVCCRAYNLTVTTVVWGCYYKNVIFISTISRSVRVGENLIIFWWGYLLFERLQCVQTVL